MHLMFIRPCIIAIVEEWKTNLMSLVILFHLLCAQHVSDINIPIFKSLRLCWWITTSVVFFSVRCVLEFLLRLIFGGVLLQPAKRTPPNISRNKSSNTQRTENKTTDVVIHQHSRRLLKMDTLLSETCWAHKKWNKIASDIKLVFHSSTVISLSLWMNPDGPAGRPAIQLPTTAMCLFICKNFKMWNLPVRLRGVRVRPFIVMTSLEAFKRYATGHAPSFLQWSFFPQLNA